MNPHITALHPYPFEKLQALFAGITPPHHLHPIRLSIGEPQHATPQRIKTALTEHLEGLATYPQTLGEPALRTSIAEWLCRRYQLPQLDATQHIIPTNGSREALFSFVQCIIATQGHDATPLVLMPNPFYQIYEGAALLAGAQAYFYNQTADNHYAPDFTAIDSGAWARMQLVFVCSPGNPTGHVLSLDDWRTLFTLSDRYNFVIAADECYSEIYDEAATPPLGALQAAHQLGRCDYRNLVIFSSLSKRSNAPGLRSGFVAGDHRLITQYARYRTYHGCAMSPPVQHASIAAWQDETHVRENRRLYAEKFACVLPILQQHLEVSAPAAGFYLWAATPGIADDQFARGLYQHYNVTLLPGSFLARSAYGANPGAGRLRIALVPSLEECQIAAQRINAYCKQLLNLKEISDERPANPH